MNEKRNVYIIYGFLESGKSQFIDFTVSQDYFKQDEPTLIIQCEEGEVEYDETKLKSLNTSLETVEEFEEFNPDNLETMASKYNADRIIIEYNGI